MGLGAVLSRVFGVPVNRLNASARSGQSAGQPTIHNNTRYFYLGPDVAITRLIDGHHLFVDPQDESVSSHLIAHGFWETWIHSVVWSLVQPGDRVIEVGANLGYYTIAMALKVGAQGSVVALEANPRLAALVQRSVDFNGYGDRVRVVPKAATNDPGPVSFMVSRRNSGGGHSGVAPGHVTPGMEEVRVDGVKLDDLCDHADFIRMDAEGSEPLILRGAERLLQNPKITVCLEWDTYQMGGRADVHELVMWLTTLGFKFWKIETTASLTPVSPADMATLAACDVVMSRTDPRFS